ncbi:hypothetical protein IJT93_09775 [bacterium]|nr:hypothetical protein [bacterium]
MANYPCAQCGAMVDTSGDGVCKKCKSKKPFKCSKCGKAVGLESVFKPHKLTHSGKPLYCDDCGSDNEQLPCTRCGKTLIRSTGVEVPVNGELKVYHKECLDQQRQVYRKIMPVCVAIGACIVGYAAYMFVSNLGVVLLFAVIGGLLGKLTADKYLGLH